ncbi:hypothetical protein ACLOJK_005834 [Asimina triloba]
MASIAASFAISAKPRISASFGFESSRTSKSSHLIPSRLRNPPKSQTRRTLVPVVRAGIQIPDAIRPGNGVETDKLPTDVRKRAMEAVDSFGGRVTIGDVAGRAGLKLNEAERALQALAADTGGFLEVSDEGDVLYVFPRDYRAKLVGKSFRMKIEPLLEKTKAAGEYLIRVSFGTTLIVSIVVVYTAIITLLSSRSFIDEKPRIPFPSFSPSRASQIDLFTFILLFLFGYFDIVLVIVIVLLYIVDDSDEDNRGRRGGRAYDSNFTVFFRPSDLFWYWDPYYYRRQRTRADDGMNFIESIGQYIASNGGVVTAEELAPYLDVLPDGQAMDDESYILPVLLRFDGHPEVDEEQGNILYRFPSLQRTASSRRSGRKEYVGKKWAEWVGGVDSFFKEKKWQFSKILEMNVAVTPGGFISFVADIFPLLQVYAASFFAIPLFRWFLVRQTNAQIEKRNRARKQRAQALEMPDPTLRRKSVVSQALDHVV